MGSIPTFGIARLSRTSRWLVRPAGRKGNAEGNRLDVAGRDVRAKFLAATADSKGRWRLDMTIPEAAEYLRCSRQRIDDLLSQRRLMRFKEGARKLVRRDEIEAHLSRSTSGGS